MAYAKHCIIGAVQAWLICLAMLGTLGLAPARAQAQEDLGFPDPDQAGFHNAALVYAESSLNAESVRPLFSRQDATGKAMPGEPLFDAAVLLRFSINGIQTDYGRTTMNDWTDILDQWFKDDGPIDALERASADSQNPAGPVRRRSVIIMMPWLNSNVASFGTVDGQDRNLSSGDDRRAVTRWFAREVDDRFKRKHADHLKLWGLYRMREDVTPFENHLIRNDNDGVHQAGLRCLFIPYFKAAGWDRWKENGFDLAIMQPSYAFRSSLDGGSVNASRLEATALAARTHGLGVELEFRGCARLKSEQAMADQYLAYGISTGYRQGASAAFLGEGFGSCGIVTSQDPAQHAIYDHLADYLAGRSVPSPDRDLHMQAVPEKIRGASQNLILEASGIDPGRLGAVRLEMQEGERHWMGKASLEGRGRDGSWRPLGWAYRAAADALADDYQGIVIRLDQSKMCSTVRQIRLVLQTSPDSPVDRPNNLSVMADASQESTTTNGLANAITTVESPASQTGPYPDASSHELHDGRISRGGWSSGLNVGWDSDPGNIGIMLDLGAPQEVARVRVHTQGGSDAGVNWPLNGLVRFSNSPVLVDQGTADTASADRGWGFSAPVVTGRHGPAYGDGLPSVAGVTCLSGAEAMCTNQDGYLDAAGMPATARYLGLHFTTNAWAMISEIEVFNRQGTPLDFTYRLIRNPSQRSDYSDDGLKLTDGFHTGSFVPSQLSGWTSNTPVSLRFDTPKPIDITRVSLWTLDNAPAGIRSPDGFTAEAQVGGSWIPLTGRLAKTDLGADGVRLNLECGLHQNVDSVRIRLPGLGPGHTWTMLSEVSTESYG